MPINSFNCIYLTTEAAKNAQRTQRIIEIENELARQVIGSAIIVHRALGPGLLGSAYKEYLFYGLIKKGLYVEKEKPLPPIYEEIKLRV